MEKNNLSSILIGLCLGIIMLFGIGLWKMNYQMKQNAKENLSLRSALADKMDQISQLSQEQKVRSVNLNTFASDTQDAISQIEEQHIENKVKQLEQPQAPIDFDGSAQSWIHELKNELEELSRQENELLSVLSEEQEGLDPLSQELAQIEDKYSSMVQTESASKELKFKVASLEERLSFLKNEKQDLEIQIEGMQSKSNNIIIQNKELKSEVKGLEEEIKDLSKAGNKSSSKRNDKKLNKLKEEISEFKNTVADLKGKLAVKNKEVKKIDEEKDELTRKIIKLQGDLVKVREADSDSARVKLMQDKIEELEEDKKELRKSLNSMQDKYAGIEDELKLAQDGREELANESKKMKFRLSAIEDERDEKADAIERLEKELIRQKKSDKGDGKLIKTLEEEKEKFEKVNNLYSRLKGQLKEVALILAKRDELITKREAQLLSVEQEKEYLSKKVVYLEEFFEKFKNQQNATYEKLNGMDNLKEVDVVVSSSAFEE